MDLILEYFLEQAYPTLSPQQQKLFAQILDETDLDIMDWIVGRAQPADKDYEVLIDLFRQHKLS